MQVAVLISGRGSNLDALIQATTAPNYPAIISLVISNNPDAGGLAIAAQAGISTLVINHRDFDRREEFDQALDEQLQAHRVDLVCHAGFMRILTAPIVNKWRGKMLNIHPSLLPMLPGLNTHERALQAGLKIHGCTVHFVTADLDAGPIIVQGAVTVHTDDTEDALAARVLHAEHNCYAKALAMVARGEAKMVGSRVHFRDVPQIDGLIISP